MGWKKLAAFQLILAAHQRLEQRIMALSQEVTDTLTAVSEQLDKATSEIVAKIDELAAAVADPTPEQQEKLDGLRAAAQRLDDVVPDATPEEPETPAEPTP
jgi:ABC-type transporter Mla subunit MlaD